MENTEEMVRRVNGFVAHRLKARRLQQGMTQVTLGREVGVTFQQIQKYEKGKSVMSVGRLYQLARTLETSPLYFFEGLETSRAAATVGGREEWFRLATALASIDNVKVRTGIKQLIQVAGRIEHTLQMDRKG